MPSSRLLSLHLDGLKLTDIGKMRKFKPIDVVEAGKRLGKPSVHGYVHELYMRNAPKGMNPNTLYVAKYVEFKGSNNPNIEYNGFINEIIVGGDPNISNKRIGPGIVAYYVSPTDSHGVIIMDNFLMGRDPQEYASIYLADFLDRGCPAPNSRFVRLTKDVLEKFYRVTKGYHGDLHGSNMQVIIHKATARVENVYVFDYGAHKRFRNPFALSKCKSLSSILDFINSEFENNYARQKYGNRFISGGLKHIATNYEEIRRSNAKLLPLVFGDTYSHITSKKKNNSPATPKSILSVLHSLFSGIGTRR